MTQRIFDIENEKDYADLWDILPDETEKARKVKTGIEFLDKENEPCLYIQDGDGGASIIKINWHDKTEITRPIQEATEADAGKLCYFWDDDGEYKGYAILSLKDVAGGKPYYIADGTTTYDHCRRLTKQEIKELC